MPLPRALAKDEKQLLITEYENTEKRFENINKNEYGVIRIKINKEQRVVNHLESHHENQNLLFYNFNANSSTNEQLDRPTRGGRNRGLSEYSDNDISDSMLPSLQKTP